MSFDEAGYPLNPFDEVAPGLFQSSSARKPAELFEAGFQAVFDLCGVNRGEGVEARLYIFHQIDDVPWFDDAEAMDALAIQAASLIQSGASVVVSCMSGLNRSGLLVARTLIELGYSPPEAISLVRQARGVHALSNQHFTRWLLLDCTPKSLAARFKHSQLMRPLGNQ